jgi:hypothetical protein
MDTFLLPPRIISESFTESSSSYGAKKAPSYYIEAESGNRYKVPENVYIELGHDGKQFRVSRSKLFQKGLAVTYSFNEKEKTVNIGFINQGFGFTLAMIAIIFILVSFIATPLLRRYSSSFVFCALLIVVLISIFYFFRHR